MQFREQTIDNFSIVFDNQGGEEEGVNEGIIDKFSDNWSWYCIIYRLTNGNIEKLNKIINTSLYECLTWLTYEAELEEQQKNIKLN